MLEEQKADIISQESNSPKSVCGIDALYFYVKVNLDHYSEFYQKSLLNKVLENDDNFELLSYNYEKQFTYFNILTDLKGFKPNKVLCKIGFKNLNDRDNLDSIIIQMDTQLLNYLGYKDSIDLVLDNIRSLGLEVLKTKVSRVDLNTYVLGHNFEYLNSKLFSTRSPKSSTTSNVESNGVLETFTLGSRSTDSVFLRIYNKNKELNSLELSDYSGATFKEMIIKHKFMKKYLLLDIDISENLWNVEFEIKRGTLRRYSIESIEDLYANIDSIHADICKNTFRMLSEPKKSINNTRLKTSPIWNHIVNEYKIFNEPILIDKTKLKQYKKDSVWLLNRLIDFIEEENNLDYEFNQDILDLISKMSRGT